MNFNLKEIITAGGPIFFALILLSVYSIAVMLERWRYFKKQMNRSSQITKEVRRFLSVGNIEQAVEMCKNSKTATAQILLKAIGSQGNRFARKEYMETVIDWHSSALQNRLSVLGTLGSTTPYIGLFGTVLGVMRAFRDLANFAGAGPSVVANGIAEALINTAAGLFVAIPAIYAYNYFTARANRFADEMSYACEEIIYFTDNGEKA